MTRLEIPSRKPKMRVTEATAVEFNLSYLIGFGFLAPLVAIFLVYDLTSLATNIGGRLPQETIILILSLFNLVHHIKFMPPSPSSHSHYNHSQHQEFKIVQDWNDCD